MCDEISEVEADAAAEVVFEGRAVYACREDRSAQSRGESFSFPRTEIGYRFAVDKWVRPGKGDAFAWVYTGVALSGDCGMAFRQNESVRVYAQRFRGGLVTNVCQYPSRVWAKHLSAPHVAQLPFCGADVPAPGPATAASEGGSTPRASAPQPSTSVGNVQRAGCQSCGVASLVDRDAAETHINSALLALGVASLRRFARKRRG